MIAEAISPIYAEFFHDLAKLRGARPTAETRNDIAGQRNKIGAFTLDGFDVFVNGPIVAEVTLVFLRKMHIGKLQYFPIRSVYGAVRVLFDKSGRVGRIALRICLQQNDVGLNVVNGIPINVHRKRRKQNHANCRNDHRKYDGDGDDDFCL